MRVAQDGAKQGDPEVSVKSPELSPHGPMSQKSGSVVMFGSPPSWIGKAPGPMPLRSKSEHEILIMDLVPRTGPFEMRDSRVSS
jgi:hypothetical protein